MTDDELLRRLAWIEKADLMNRAGGALAPYWKHDAMGVHEPWNPLTRDAQAMALMKKYLLTVMWSGQWEVVHEGNNSVLSVGEDESLNRAICMAIVEAHGGTER